MNKNDVYPFLPMLVWCPTSIPPGNVRISGGIEMEYWAKIGYILLELKLMETSLTEAATGVVL